MVRIENCVHGVKGLSTETDKSFPYGEKCLKHILACLYCTKYSEIIISHSDIQKHVFHEKWFK